MKTKEQHNKFSINKPSKNVSLCIFRRPFTQLDIQYGKQKCWGFYLYGAVIGNILKALEPITASKVQSKVNNLKFKVPNLPKYLPLLYFSFHFPVLLLCSHRDPNKQTHTHTHSLAAQQGSGKLIRALRQPHGKGHWTTRSYTHTHTHGRAYTHSDMHS